MMANESQWEINRVGLINFWYYDEEYFDFSDGKLLLRGSNGSGKSVTMQSLIPVLLDGKTASNRLDSFGSRARKMEDYLLGEESVTKKNERIGYLFIEYKKKGHEIYFTSGIGMQAKRGNGLQTWYFALTDNRRIKYDFSLFEDLGGDNLQPLTKRRLSNRIDSGGMVLSSQKEYQELVNQRIFGFATLEDFNNCIKLLIQLRSPKLSKEFTPTAIFEILTNALPTLKEEDLQPVSNTLEQIDSSRLKLEQLEREERALNKLNDAYEMFYTDKLRNIAKKWLDNKASTDKKQQELNRKRKEYTELLQEQAWLEEEEQTIRVNLAIWREENEELSKHQVFQLISEEEKIKEALVKGEKAIEKLEKQLKLKEGYILSITQKTEALEIKMAEYNRELVELLNEMDDHAETAGYLAQHQIHLDSYNRSKDRPALSYWRKQNTANLHHLQACIEKLKDLQRETNELKRIDGELGSTLEERDQHAKKILHWQQIFVDEREKVEGNLIEWRKELPFELKGTVFNEILHNLESIYEEFTRFDDIIKPLYKVINEEEQRLAREIIPIDSEIDILKTKINNKELEKKEWQEKREPEPLRSGASSEFREYLHAQKKDIYPFYDCVDYRKEITEEVKNKLEGALLESGIVDALVANEKLELDGDKQLIPSPLKDAKATLAEYLVPDCDSLKVDKEIIQGILQSIEVTSDALDQNESWKINTDGTYQVSLMRGKVSSKYQATFIGKSSRERYRKEQIEKLMGEIITLTYQVNELQDKKQQLNQKKEMVKVALEALPEDENMLMAFNEKSNEEKLRADCDLKLERTQNLLTMAQKKVNSLKMGLKQFNKNDELVLDLFVFQEALKSMQDYEEAFLDWESKLRDFQTAETQRRTDQEQLSIHEEEQQDIVMELEDINLEFSIGKKKLASNQERQKLSEAQDILERMTLVKQNIHKSESREKDMQESIQQCIGNQAITKHHLSELEKKLKFAEPFTDLLEKTFLNEFKRYNQLLVDNLLENAAMDLLNNWEYNDSQFNQYEKKLDNEFHLLENTLLDYRPIIKKKNIMNEPEWLENHTNEEALSMMENWRTINQQKILEVNSEGTWKDPKLLINQLNLQIEKTRLMLRTSDEELFEQIIFHSVGKIIRQLIQKAQKWIVEMNEILMGQDNSSGLTLSIKWLPISGGNEDELSTKELVKLLKKDTSILKEEDTELMKKHFQSKIKYAKELRDEGDNEESLYQVLQQVLDYRKWFEFELKYSRGNVAETKLNNIKFNQFSGGEKAICMYLPLFTAIYSRYQDASKNAPYIITLDEAFAGIDNLNIAELFKATEQLGFNYIMNSQALYGEFSTVSSLNTYELIRPKNAPIVSTLQYHWDGNTKTVVLPKEEIAYGKE
ncbi:TIGR02680 family protein [Listeria seeligeri]|uniref:TIGR02680 family protein n=1 Tax=Listeria seeligeri TaxID=1640 RepID=UPI001887F8BD|nr:TIGR02680 family protein [Listeria seeligeri]MBF2663975.1 TIGR02680 family protein [Listeria seeligeri]